MPLTVNGIRYLSLTEVADLVGRHRTTLWRWREQRKIPEGLRYCDQHLLYDTSEVEEIYAYAHRLQPDAAREGLKRQLNLFSKQRR
jgi:predicted DNA-binding transcriptional regulator AlpA